MPRARGQREWGHDIPSRQLRCSCIGRACKPGTPALPRSGSPGCATGAGRCRLEASSALARWNHRCSSAINLRSGGGNTSPLHILHRALEGARCRAALPFRARLEPGGSVALAPASYSRRYIQNLASPPYSQGRSLLPPGAAVQFWPASRPWAEPATVPKHLNRHGSQ